jgi:hypothetical protein
MEQERIVSHTLRRVIHLLIIATCLLGFMPRGVSQSIENALSATSPSITASNGYLVLGYYQLKNTPFDYYFQTSVDLAHWTTPNSPNPVYAVDDGAAWFNTIADTVPMISGSARFLRLSIFDPTNVTDFLFPPTNLSVTLPPGGATYAVLAWSDNTMIETGYAILRETGTSGTFQEIATVGTDVTTYSDYAVQGSTAYTYEVAAFDSDEQSAPSNQASVTTLLDSNGDGIADIYKPLWGINPNDGTDSAGGSGLPDGWLVQYGLNPLTTVDADTDLIGKGWSRWQDYQNGTNPNMVDTDGDGVPDAEDEYPLDPNRSQDVPIPPLLSVDTSSAVATSNVTASMMDSQGNEGFGFVSGTDAYGNPTSYSTYVWTSGSATLSQSLSVSGSTRTVSYVTPDGAALGWDAAGITAYEAQRGNVTDIYPPEPLFGPASPASAGGSTPLGGSAEGPYFSVNGVVNDSVYWGTIFGVPTSGSSSYDPYQANSALYSSGQWVLFNPQLSQLTGASIPSNVTVWDAAFSIAAATSNGYAVGSGVDYDSDLNGYLFFDGTQFAQLPGSPSAVNTSGQVVGTTGTTGTSSGYLWTTSSNNSGSSVSIQSLLPSVFQKQINNIAPQSISNEDSTNANAVQIQFSAQSLQGSGTGSWVENVFLLTNYPSNPSANTLVQYNPSSVSFAAQMTPQGVSSSQTYDSSTQKIQAIQQGTPQFELRNNSDVMNGWDSSSQLNGPPAPDPWTCVATGSTNSFVKLYCPATKGLELAIAPGSEKYITLNSGTTLAITGTETDLSIKGVASTTSTNAGFGNFDAQVILRQQSSPAIVSGTLHVQVFGPQSVYVDVFYASDSANAASALPATLPTGSQIINEMNATFVPQANVNFVLRISSTLPNCTGAFDSSGNLNFESMDSSGFFPLWQNCSDASFNVDSQDTVWRIFIVKHLLPQTYDAGTFLDLEDGHGYCYTFVNSTAGIRDYAHEGGRAFGLPSAPFGIMVNKMGPFDMGPWPFEFKTISDPYPAGLMNDSTGTQERWIRHQDWDQSNVNASKAPFH